MLTCCAHTVSHVHNGSCSRGVAGRAQDVPRLYIYPTIRTPLLRQDVRCSSPSGRPRFRTQTYQTNRNFKLKNTGLGQPTVSPRTANIYLELQALTTPPHSLFVEQLREEVRPITLRAHGLDLQAAVEHLLLQPEVPDVHVPELAQALTGHDASSGARVTLDDNLQLHAVAPGPPASIACRGCAMPLATWRSTRTRRCSERWCFEQRYCA